MTLTNLHLKGGIMFFTIEREDLVYRGAVLLSPLVGGQRKRIVCAKVYRYKEVQDETDT